MNDIGEGSTEEESIDDIFNSHFKEIRFITQQEERPSFTMDIGSQKSMQNKNNNLLALPNSKQED